MKHRVWLLVVAAFVLAYALAIQHFSIPFIITYGADSFVSAFHLSFVLIGSWTVLECVHHRTMRNAAHYPPKCGHCNYPLVGMRCPECGKVVGSSETGA